MQGMICKYLLIVLATAVVISCSKDAARKHDTYTVSARKMIGLKSNNWSNAEPQLKDKKGYQYMKSPENLSAVIKAEVHLPAIDDSNRVVNGAMLLNIAPDNGIFYTSFITDPLAKSEAYAMMLNYYNESLKTLTDITFSIGEIVENGRGENVSIGVIVSKVESGHEADQVAITYRSRQGKFILGLFRKNDGRYVFSYRGIA
jgi:hypothetical protein